MNVIYGLFWQQSPVKIKKNMAVAVVRTSKENPSNTNCSNTRNKIMVLMVLHLNHLDETTFFDNYFILIKFFGKSLSLVILVYCSFGLAAKL